MRDIDELQARPENLRPWQDAAACRQGEGAMFFGPDSERRGARARREASAKTICSRCPVLEECRAHALRVDEPSGIWGGLTEEERVNLKSMASI